MKEVMAEKTESAWFIHPQLIQSKVEVNWKYSCSLSSIYSMTLPGQLVLIGLVGGYCLIFHRCPFHATGFQFINIKHA